MLKFRFALLSAAAALALGTAGAVAMQANLAGTTERDSHGDAVASAARTTCPHGSDGVHGECVSDIASAEGQENRDGAQSERVEACKASDKTEDTTEKKPTTKADKTLDRAEDKREHTAFAACVSGHTAAGRSK
jgi:hypothetical protein